MINDRICLSLAFAALIIGSTSLLGWFIDSTALITWLPGHTAIQFNATLCVIIAAITQILLFTDKKILFNILIAVLLLISGITVLDYFTDSFNWVHILLFDPWYELHTPVEGRMALQLATSFGLIGLFGVFLRNKLEFYTQLAILAGITSILLILSISTIFFYIFNVHVFLYAINDFTPMALPAAISLTILTIAKIFYIRHMICMKTSPK